jgi:hypothetical protein
MLYPQEWTPGTHWIGYWVGLRAGLDTEARWKVLCLCLGSHPGCPMCSQTLFTELLQFLYTKSDIEFPGTNLQHNRVLKVFNILYKEREPYRIIMSMCMSFPNNFWTPLWIDMKFGTNDILLRITPRVCMLFLLSVITT